jgi:glycosyltransferase involved in cell wall biosynthesis
MSYHFIKERDIILFSQQPWNERFAFNFRDMAYELARYNRVLFVDRATDRNTLLKERLGLKPSAGRPAAGIEQVADRLWVLHPECVLESVSWVPYYRLFDFFNRINNRRLAAEIKTAIRRLGFENSLLLNDNDFYRGLYLKALLPVRKYIFYIRDFLTDQPFFRKFGPRCEKEMIEKADLIVANSAYLAAYAGRWNPHCADIGQGINPGPFLGEMPPVPADLQAIPRPVLGYCGALTRLRLDEDLLLHLARSFPEASFVLLGPADNTGLDKGPLSRMSNVYFPGAKRPEETAAYIRHFDICLNPQALNELTVGNYPRKIDEYLAAGKPVLATATEAMELFRDHVFLCASAAEYVAHIRSILEKPEWNSEAEQERRRAFALTHTWERSVGELGNALHQLEKSYQLQL